ncbi:MAG: Calx-beta domain-containing protein [Pirellulales bacterium]
MATVPIYHSLPEAPAALYLDFDGHFERVWGSYSDVDTPVYDSDREPTIYSATELTFIESVWRIVSEDFALFNIDVTTEEPPVLAAGVPIDQANGVALRVAIGGSNTDWYQKPAGGVGYVDSFTDGIANTVYAFTKYEGEDTNAVFVGSTASHEAGHAFGLEHQSQYDASGAKVEEYLPPIGNWSAIMGSHQNLDHATWHNGQNSKGAAVYQDDIAMIGRAINRLGYRADDHGNTTATSSPLIPAGRGWTSAGLVGATTDVDVFSFTTIVPRDLRITVDGNAPGQNLDAVLELYDAQGGLLASSNPDNSLDAFLEGTLTVPGTYFVAVKSSAQYGRIGQYWLNVSPIASVSIADTSIAEGDAGQRNATFVVTLSDAVNEIVAVSFSTVNGTATAWSDYIPQVGIVTFLPGELTQMVTVLILGDTQVEPDEHFFLILSNAFGANILAGEAVGAILDDDTPSIRAEEQLFVYLLNRARHAPVAYQQEQSLPVDLSDVEPRPPLAINDSLFASARFHTDEMATHNYYDTRSAISGDWPNKMARNRGYELPAHFSNDVNNIESRWAGTSQDTADEVLEAFITHSQVLLGSNGFAANREIGVGHSFSPSSNFGHYWAVHTAWSNASDRFLTGVVFDDRNNNQRYDLNEGLAGVRVAAGLFSTETNAAGGWTIEVNSPGSYVVTASGGQFGGVAAAFVQATANNVEVDFISGNNQGIVNFEQQPEIVPPSALVASVQAPNRVRLVWTDNSWNDTGFRIDRSTDGVNYSTLVDLPANATSYDDVGLQSNVTYSYRVRALGLQTQSDASNVASATPQLTIITGTSGNDTYHVIRVGSFLQVYENTGPGGQPTYSSTLAAMPGTLTINTLAGNDLLTVGTVGQSLGLGQLIYDAGTGANSLVLESGSARIDATALGGLLNTEVKIGAHLTTARLRQNGLTLNENSKVSLLPDGDASVLTSLTLVPAATLDITNNALVIDYIGTSPVDIVRERILSGRGGAGFGATWTGKGIASSTAAQRNTVEPEAWSVGYAENGVLPLGSYSTFRGLSVNDTAVLIAFTRTGDANLDGVVDDNDVTIVGATYAPSVPQPQWALGDFDYNGFVDDDDVTLLGVFYSPTAEAVATPPVKDEEPAAAGRPFTNDEVAASAVSGGGVRGEGYVVARSPDRATLPTAGLLAFSETMETFGRDDVRGRETRAQHANDAREDGADDIVDLLAQAIVAETARYNDGSSDRRWAVGRPAREVGFFWPV